MRRCFRGLVAGGLRSPRSGRSPASCCLLPVVLRQRTTGHPGEDRPEHLSAGGTHGLGGRGQLGDSCRSRTCDEDKTGRPLARTAASMTGNRAGASKITMSLRPSSASRTAANRCEPRRSLGFDGEVPLARNLEAKSVAPRLKQILDLPVHPERVRQPRSHSRDPDTRRAAACAGRRPRARRDIPPVRTSSRGSPSPPSCPHPRARSTRPAS